MEENEEDMGEKEGVGWWGLGFKKGGVGGGYGGCGCLFLHGKEPLQGLHCRDVSLTLMRHRGTSRVLGDRNNFLNILSLQQTGASEYFRLSKEPSYPPVGFAALDRLQGRKS